MGGGVGGGGYMEGGTVGQDMCLDYVDVVQRKHALSSVLVSGLVGVAFALGLALSSFLPSFAFALGSGLEGFADFDGLDSFAGAAAFDFLDLAGLQASQYSSISRLL